jgi:hypothetical protein
VLGGATLGVSAQGRPVALAVILFAKAVQCGPVDAEQRRLPAGLHQAIKIDQQTHHAIAEAVGDGF